MGRTFAPVPPKYRFSLARKASASSILSKGMPGSSAVWRLVKVTLPFPNFSAHSPIIFRSWAENMVPAGTTRPEKHSVPRLSRKPRPLTRTMSSFGIAISYPSVCSALFYPIIRLLSSCTPGS